MRMRSGPDVPRLPTGDDASPSLSVAGSLEQIERCRYPTGRYSADGSEVHTELWGLRQDDAIGLAIWALSRWQERFDLFRNDYEDFHLVQKLIWYCDRILVPHIPDNGIWEEEGPTKTIHLS